MDLIASFLDRYVREYDYFARLAEFVASRSESALQRAAIRAVVTFRAKRPDRLEEKLRERNRKRAYSDDSQMYEDIVDLAGCRIALYFPDDFEKTEKLLNEEFVVKNVKQFPEGKKEWSPEDPFVGYVARHYHVELDSARLDEELKRFSKRTVEIQVASLLMHAWAEVEHDLTYKPTSGQPSSSETSILRELNGLVLAGELALRRLQRAVAERVTADPAQFSNHYELGSFIYEWLTKKQRAANYPNTNLLGLDVLFRFLSECKMASPIQLEPVLEQLQLEGEDADQLTQRIVDLILLRKPELYREYERIRPYMERLNPYAGRKLLTSVPEQQQAIGMFLREWTKLEQIIGYLSEQADSRKNIRAKRFAALSPRHLVEFLSSHEYLSAQDAIEVEHLRNEIRNRVVHGAGPIEPESIVRATQRVGEIVTSIWGKIPVDTKRGLQRHLSSVGMEIP